MFNNYFKDFDVKPEYSKEYVSLWPTWLGKENLHQLDNVSEKEWSRFNNWIRSLVNSFLVEVADCQKQTLTKITDIETVLSNYSDSMNKDSSSFIRLVLPELGCVISEEWDYTYIIWHKKNGAVEKLSPLIKNSRLEHFNDGDT